MYDSSPLSASGPHTLKRFLIQVLVYTFDVSPWTMGVGRCHSPVLACSAHVSSLNITMLQLERTQRCRSSGLNVDFSRSDGGLRSLKSHTLPRTTHIDASYRSRRGYGTLLHVPDYVLPLKCFKVLPSVGQHVAGRNAAVSLLAAQCLSLFISKLSSCEDLSNTARVQSACLAKLAAYACWSPHPGTSLLVGRVLDSTP